MSITAFNNSTADELRVLYLTWGQNLREARLALGISQEALAEGIGRKQQEVSKWERGMSPPHDRLRPRIAEMVHRPVHQLFSYETLAR